MPLSYQTTGATTDSPLLFLHGLGSSCLQTTSAFPELKGHYVIAPDMPGHGDSLDFSVDDLNFDRFADLVIELMDQLSLDSVDLGGLSMGSGITLNIALRYPERVKKIIILRPSWLSEKQPEHLKLVAYVGQWIEELGKEAAKEKLQNDSGFQQLVANNPPVAKSIEELFERPETDSSIAVLYKMWQDAPFTSPEALSVITNETLVITTGRDELHPKSTAEVIAAHLPNVETADLSPRYHQPEEYGLELNAIVQKFLAG